MIDKPEKKIGSEMNFEKHIYNKARDDYEAYYNQELAKIKQALKRCNNVKEVKHDR